MHNDVQATSTRQLLAQIRQSLDDLSENQIQMGKARKELLVKRERLRTASRRVQVKRVEAGDAEAKFMNALREFVNKYDSVLSLSLFESYEVVAKIRDDLGEMEEDYLQAERDLAGKEWIYMDQEDAFYQFDIHDIVPDSIDGNYALQQDQRQTASLFPPPPPPFYPGPSAIESSKPYATPGISPPAPSPPTVTFEVPAKQFANLPQRAYSTIAAELNDLKRDFDQLREQQAHNIQWEDGNEVPFEDGADVSEAESTSSTETYLGVLHKICNREAEALQLRIVGLDQNDEATTITRRNSDTLRLPDDTGLHTAKMRRTKTESDASFTENDPATKAKIRQWSLQHLKDNAVQKRLYWKALEQIGVSKSVTEDWKERAEEYWSRDSMSETGEFAEIYEPSINGDGCAAESCDDARNVKNYPSASPSLEDILECKPRHQEEIDRNPFHSRKLRPAQVRHP